MAEITVDAKPMEKLPYDPADIPDAVKKRAAAVDALYNKPTESEDSSRPSETPEPTVLPVATPTPPQATETAPPTPPAPAETSRPPETEESWKVRYHRMQGQYNASQKTIGEMQEQMSQLGNELLHLQRMPPQQNPQNGQVSYPPPPSYLTEQDVQNYGNELIDVTQRAALHAMAPELQEIKRQNAQLQERLAKEARRGLDQAVELAVPNYREIDRDPRWHHWLLGIDLYTGRVRQQLLNEAIAQAAAPRVVSFFKGFLREEAATGHSESAPISQQATAPREAAISLTTLAAPGRARPATGGDASLPTEKPIYTRALVAKLYSDHRKGAYVGREAEWARLEADMYTAQREGRYRT